MNLLFLTINRPAAKRQANPFPRGLSASLLRVWHFMGGTDQHHSHGTRLTNIANLWEVQLSIFRGQQAKRFSRPRWETSVRVDSS